MRERLGLPEVPERDRDRDRDDELARLVREGLARAVAREAERLVGLERRVLERLEQKRGPRDEGRAAGGLRPLERVRSALAFGPRPAWAVAAVTVAVGLGLFALGFWLGQRTAPVLPSEPRGVEFVLFHPTAKEVTLAISYPVAGKPEWHDIPLKKKPGGLWYISLELPPGTYEYGFKIDGQWWAYDPAADYLVLSADNTVNAVREVRATGSGARAGDQS